MKKRTLGSYCLFFLLVGVGAPWWGAESLDLRQVFESLRGTASADGMIFFYQRLPRVLLGLFAGGGLALAGAAFQVLFRNPLVEPYTIGITGGAAIGAFLTVAFPTLAFQWGPLGSAQIFSLLGTLLGLGGILVFAQRQGRMNIHVLLLAGVTVSIVTSGLILFITYLLNPYLLANFHRWMVGSVAVIGFRELSAMFPLLVPGTGLLLLYAPELNHLSLGREAALGHGVPVDQVERAVIVGGGLVTAAVVSLVGPIGFVGLIIPHIVRRVSGLDQRVVLPASFFLGGAALAFCDAIARTVMAPTELPVGVITSILGGVIFILMLSRSLDGTRTTR